MKVIGFATKMFTLWDVVESVESSDDYKILLYSYIKNISADEEKVKTMYPNVEIDRSLRGHSSFSRIVGHKPSYPEDCFPWGQYAGSKIKECNNEGYLNWISWQLTDDQQQLVNEALINNFGYKMLDGICYSPSEYEEQYDYIQRLNKVSKIINSGEPIEYTFNRNLSIDYDTECGYLFENDNPICLFFKDGTYSVNRYNGYNYGLPMINGKGKRVKGKTVRITDYTPSLSDNRWNVVVNKFEILK